MATGGQDNDPRPRPRFQPGDKVTPTQPEKWYERVAGTVFFLGDDGYLVQYPSGDRKMHGRQELRPAQPAEFVRYETAGPRPMPASDPDYPRWDSAREVWTGPLAAQTKLREPATGYTATVLAAGDQVRAVYHDPHGDQSSEEELDADDGASAFGVARRHVAQLRDQGWVLT